jgi:RHS repeat-associated protein
MIAAKQMDMVIGVDIHLIQPPGPVPPIPIPHPFIGMVLDPISFATSTVWINNMPCGTAGSAIVAAPPHIPIGGMFVPPPPGNEGEIFMGSATVLAEGEPLSKLGMKALTCQSIGMPSLPRSKKKTSPKTMLLPTSTVIAIPAGMIVLVGGPPTIKMAFMAMINDPMGALKDFAIAKLKAGILGKLMNSKAMKAISQKIHNIAGKAMRALKIPKGLRDAVHRRICSVTGHPVDIASGMVFTEITDFELSGPIPLALERVWYSTSDYEGDLGHGWHHSYDMAMSFDKNAIDETTNERRSVVVVRMPDGRPAVFEDIKIGESYFDRKEKTTLFRDERGYYIQDKNLLNYHFETEDNTQNAKPKTQNPLLKTQNAENTEGVFFLSSIEDLNGNKIQFKRNRQGALTEIIDSVGRNLSVETDDKGRILSILAPHPEDEGLMFDIVRYRYDAMGNLIESLDAHDQAMSYVYQNHWLVKETNRNGLNFFFQYFGNGTEAKCSRTWGDGGIYDHKLTYHEGYTIVENSLGHQATHYHRGGLVYKEINTKGGITFKDYNEFNDLLSERDPLGFSTNYNYDERANQTLIVAADGSSVQTVYNELDLPIMVTDQVGGIWMWTYDKKGNTISRKNPLDEVTKYAYTAPEGSPDASGKGGLLSKIEDAAKGVTSLVFDKHQNLSQATTADGQTYYWTYDNLGNCTSAVDPKGNTQKRTFDLLSQITKVEEPDGNVRTLKYDPEGNITQAKDNQYDVAFEYAGMNRLKARVQNKTRVEFKYDTEEQLLGIINEHGYAYRFDLDTEGDVIQESGFDSIRRIYERDAAGRVTKVKRANAMHTLYMYDGVGRVTGVNHSDGTIEKFEYREDGELMMAKNEATTVIFERDLLGRVLSETSDGNTIESMYDISGFRKSIKSSLGADLDFTRNIMGDVETLRANDFTAKFKRDVLGLELEREMSGGVRGRWSRDKLGRPIKHELFGTGGTAHRTRNYSWEINDRLKQLSDTSHGTTRYEHDNFGNLAAAINPDGSMDLRMPDAVGNLFRTNERNDRRYGPAGQLLEANGVRYEYDAEGNLSKKIEKRGQTWQYEWNASGMLQRVKRPDGGIVTMTYDALGRRIGKQYGQTINRWAWDGNVPLHEWQEDAAFITPPTPQFKGTEQPAVMAAMLVPDIVTWVFEAESFSPLAKLTANGNFGIITDHLGTPLSMYDQKGGTVWSADLNVYGEIRNLLGAREDCPFRYPGQYEDAETGLYYNRFRYYDAEMGGYLSQDPIGLVSNNPNLYGYVKDSNKFIDPFGLDCTENKKAGTAREEKVQAELEAKYGKDKVFRERTLRDSDGKKVVGSDGTGRRVDFVVVDDKGKPVAVIEVTSKTADKTAQAAKELEIRDSGGTFVRNPKTKELVDISSTPTTLRRED